MRKSYQQGRALPEDLSPDVVAAQAFREGMLPEAPEGMSPEKPSLRRLRKESFSENLCSRKLRRVSNWEKQRFRSLRKECRWKNCASGDSGESHFEKFVFPEPPESEKMRKTEVPESPERRFFENDPFRSFRNGRFLESEAFRSLRKGKNREKQSFRSLRNDGFLKMTHFGASGRAIRPARMLPEPPEKVARYLHWQGLPSVYFFFAVEAVRFFLTGFSSVFLMISIHSSNVISAGVWPLFGIL